MGLVYSVSPGVGVTQEEYAVHIRSRCRRVLRSTGTFRIVLDHDRLIFPSEVAGEPLLVEPTKMIIHAHEGNRRRHERLRTGHPIDDLSAVVSAADVINCQKVIREVHVDPKVRDYILDLIEATREPDDLSLGGSPRASIGLFRAAQSLAAIRGNDFVTPDNVKRIAAAVLSHRLIVRPESRLRKITAATVVQEILDSLDRDTVLREAKKEIQARLGLS